MSSGELTQVEAMQTLPPGLALLKMENESIQALAAAHPRDHAAILADIKQQLDAYPQFAAGAIYNKPVGTVTVIVCKCGERYEVPYVPRDGVECPKCGGGEIQSKRKLKKFARNLSIRTAESLAEAYGFNRVRSEITPIDAVTVKVEATFTDYQKGRIWQDAGIVSKTYKDRYGKTKTIPDDRFYNVTTKAEASRRIREVILRSMPAGLKLEVRAHAEQTLEAALTDKVMGSIVEKFGTKGVTLEMLEHHVGKTRVVGWTKADRLNLLGIWTAIEDGETTVHEAFGEEEADPDGPGDQGTADLDERAAKLKDKAPQKPRKKPAAETQVDPAVEKTDGVDDESMATNSARTSSRGLSLEQQNLVDDYTTKTVDATSLAALKSLEAAMNSDGDLLPKAFRRVQTVIDARRTQLAGRKEK